LKIRQIFSTVEQVEWMRPSADATFCILLLNEVDMTVAATDYEIKTEQTFVDGFIGAFTGGLITVRTVTITE